MPLQGRPEQVIPELVSEAGAEAVHVSGVLAVVVAGLIVGHDTPRLGSGALSVTTGGYGGRRPARRPEAG